MAESTLKCASYFSYTPRPATGIERESKEAMRRIKNDSIWPESDHKTTSYIARSVAESATGDFRNIFMGGKAAIVPVPKSSLISRGDLWVPYNMAAALVEYGLGSSVVPCLKRSKAIQKAAFSKPKDRPKAATHRETIAVGEVVALGKVVLVDDVVTTGATLVGTAEKLRSVFPNAEITAFAAMRTESFGGFKKIRDPKVETITLYPSGKTFRG